MILSLKLLAHGQIHQVSSPDNKLHVVVEVKNGNAFYSVHYEEITFIENSTLGMQTNDGDFSNDLSLEKNVQVSTYSNQYELPNIKKSKVDYHANEAIFSFNKEDKPAFDAIFRVSNNNIAFKYKIYPQKDKKSAMVLDESTGFVFPEGTTTFLCPQMHPMTGFAGTAPSYETDYTVDAATDQNGWGEGYTFPCLFKVKDAGWLSISETGVDGSYCGSRLLNVSGNSYKLGFPQEAENNGNGTTAPGIALPGETPWRTITIGNTLKPIAETTIPFDVVKPKYPASQKYEFTKGSWSWVIKMDNNTTFPVQKEYIDFSAAMGYKTILVDALWDTQIGKEKISELAQYGKQKGIGLYLWYNSNGYWNHAPQSPKGLMHNPVVRRKEMAWMQSIGIKGIKVDFFGGDKQVTMQLYEDILYDANDFGLMVIFHGCTLPRGWERMYPNFASSEAVRASENLHFSQGACDNEAFSATIHPFIRNTVGSMDFGGSALNQFYNANNTPNKGSKRVTSDVFALATAVLFQSGVQHFALAPNNLHDSPNWAIDFMKKVPSTWDNIKYIDGYPGKYVVLARQKGDQWYIAAINAQEQVLKLTIPLKMFNEGDRLDYYHDDNSLNGKLTKMIVNEDQEIELSIPTNGGCVITNSDAK